MGHPIHKHMQSGMSRATSSEKYDAKEAYNKDLSSKARMHYLENDIADKKGMSRNAAGAVPGVGAATTAQLVAQQNKEEQTARTAVNMVPAVGTAADAIEAGMSRYSVEKGPHAKHGNGPHRDASPLNNVTYGDKSGPTGYIGEQRADLMNINPVDNRAGMSRYGTAPDAPNAPNSGSRGVSRYGSDQGNSPAKGLKERVQRRQGKVDAARASFGTDDVDGGFDRKLNRLKRSVAKAEKRGINVDYDTTNASGEGRSRTSTSTGVSRDKDY